MAQRPGHKEYQAWLRQLVEDILPAELKPEQGPTPAALWLMDLSKWETRTKIRQQLLDAADTAWTSDDTPLAEEALK